MEAIRSSETSVHTRSTRRHIQEDGTLHGHRHENPKFYYILSICFQFWLQLQLNIRQFTLNLIYDSSPWNSFKYLSKQKMFGTKSVEKHETHFMSDTLFRHVLRFSK
jgi:hypothetical protein